MSESNRGNLAASDGSTFSMVGRCTPEVFERSPAAQVLLETEAAMQREGVEYFKYSLASGWAAWKGLGMVVFTACLVVGFPVAGISLIPSAESYDPVELGQFFWEFGQYLLVFAWWVATYWSLGGWVLRPGLHLIGDHLSEEPINKNKLAKLWETIREDGTSREDHVILHPRWSVGLACAIEDKRKQRAQAEAEEAELEVDRQAKRAHQLEQVNKLRKLNNPEAPPLEQETDGALSLVTNEGQLSMVKA